MENILNDFDWLQVIKFSSLGFFFIVVGGLTKSLVSSQENFFVFKEKGNLRKKMYLIFTTLLVMIIVNSILLAMAMFLEINLIIASGLISLLHIFRCIGKIKDGKELN